MKIRKDMLVYPCIARTQSACSRTTRAAGITSWQVGPRAPLRRSSAVGSGCTRASPVNQHRCSRRGPCAEPPLWDAPRPGSPLCWHSLAFPRDPFLRDVADTASGFRRSGFCLPDFGTFSSWNQTRASLPWNAAPPRSRRLRTVNRPSAGGCTVGQPAGGRTRRWGDGRGTGFPRWSNVAPRSVCMQPSGNRRAGAPSVVDQSRTREHRWGQWPCTLAGTRHAAPATRSIRGRAERARRAQTPHQQNRS
jgi:hypothetical protein